MNAKQHTSSSHVPIRQCVGCRARAPKRELLRLVRGDGQIVLDPQRRLAGRGAYVHPLAACVARATSRGGVFRALRTGGERAQASALRSQITAFLETESTPRQPKDQ